MTHLQVQYQQLEELKRSNLANEDIKSREATVKEREATVKEKEELLKELKLPAEIDKLVADTTLSYQQTENLKEEINKILAQVENIKENTRMTYTERRREEVGLVNDITDILHRYTGFTPVGDMIDTVEGWIGGLMGGIGKTVGGLLIS